MRTCLRKRQRSLTGKNTANFAIVGRRAGLAEARSRRFMGSSTTIPRDEEQRFNSRKSSDHAAFLQRSVYAFKVCKINGDLGTAGS
jgi:hypothetical protein